MNLQQLEYFNKIAETKNFTAAANLLSVTQPALSKAISKLEEELKVPLFERNGRNINLTSFGKTFLKHSNLALMEIEKGIKEIQDVLTSNNKTISISSTYCIGTYFMPFMISDFLSSYPEIKFQFNHQSTPDILNDLKNGKIDLGFYDTIDDIESNSKITSVAVKKEEYVLIVAKNHTLSNKQEVSLDDLKEESFITVCEGNGSKRLSCSEFIDYKNKIAMKPNEVNMLGGLVAAGAGITIVPNTPLINTNAVSIIKIKEDIGYKTIYMGWLNNVSMSSFALKFKDYMLSIISNKNSSNSL